MRPLRDMETIQIEITNHCVRQCSNCTRLIGHHQEPYFMDLSQAKEAIDSLEGFPNMVGIMGGEPLLHPEFEEISNYLSSKFSPKQCGLWTTFPNGFEKHNKIICKVYGNVFLNDHTRNDVYHQPVLVAAQEICPPKDMWYLIDKCWVQNSWSASINPKGAFFCEVAAAMALLFDTNNAWKVEKEWWRRTPKDYKEQMELYCINCGCAMPLPRRASIKEIDDISPKMFERLKDISPKLKNNKYQISGTHLEPENSCHSMASYKDIKYRSGIAEKYGIQLVINGMGYQTPYLIERS